MGQSLWGFGRIERLKMVAIYRLVSQGLINRRVEQVVIKPRREKLLRHQGLRALLISALTSHSALDHMQTPNKPLSLGSSMFCRCCE